MRKGGKGVFWVGFALFVVIVYWAASHAGFLPRLF